MVRYSFLVRLSHPLLHAGLSRRISDDFVRPIQHRLRNSETDLLGRFQVDHKLKFCWLLYREIGGLGALKNLVDVPCRAPETLSVAGCIGYEAADLYVLTSLIHRRQLVLYGKVRNPLWVTIEQSIRNRDDRAHAPLGGSLECGAKIRVRTTYLQGLKLYP